MWIRCKPTNPVPKCFFVCGAASHTQEKVFLIRPMWRNVWKRGTEEVCVCEHVSVCVCVCVSACVCVRVRYQFVQEHMLLNGLLLLYLCIFWVTVCVHLRPPAPHHQDTGLNGGSYSPFPSLLSQQVAPNVLFSLHKLLALFYSSVLSFFKKNLSSSHTLSRSVSAPSSLRLLSLLASSLASLFYIFLSFISGSLPLHTSLVWSKSTVSCTLEVIGQNWPKQVLYSVFVLFNAYNQAYFQQQVLFFTYCMFEYILHISVTILR